MSGCKKSFFLCFPLWLLSWGTGYCQKSDVELSVPKFAVNMLPATLTDLSGAADDTTQIRLLLRLSCIYYWQEKFRHDYYGVDSAVFFAQQAMTLSSQVKFTEGLNESEFLMCKISINKSDLAGARRIVEMTAGEQRVRLLIVISEHYIYLQPPLGKDNLQIAYSVLKEALALAEQLPSNNWFIKSLAAMGKYYYANGEIVRGEDFFLRIIKLFEQTHDVASQAYWWSETDYFMPYTAETYPKQLRYYQKAIDLYLSIDQKAEAASVYGDMAFLVKYAKDLDYSKRLYFKRLALLKETGSNKLYTTLMSIAEIYYAEGNLNNALTYALQGLRNIELLHAEEESPWITGLTLVL
jgi:tetratricopeptide (TPR) repeat protein